MAIAGLDTTAQNGRTPNIMRTLTRPKLVHISYTTTCLFLLIAALLICPALAADLPTSSTPLERGFHLLYDLDFVHAQQEFTGWQQQHADDPLGPASEAAGLLFSELNRLGVLEAQFYTKNATFNARPTLSPDPALRSRFNAVLARTESEARGRLRDRKSVV